MMEVYKKGKYIQILFVKYLHLIGLPHLFLFVFLGAHLFLFVFLGEGKMLGIKSRDSQMHEFYFIYSPCTLYFKSHILKQ